MGKYCATSDSRAGLVERGYRDALVGYRYSERSPPATCHALAIQRRSSQKASTGCGTIAEIRQRGVTVGAGGLSVSSPPVQFSPHPPVCLGTFATTLAGTAISLQMFLPQPQANRHDPTPKTLIGRSDRLHLRLDLPRHANSVPAQQVQVPLRNTSAVVGNKSKNCNLTGQAIEQSGTTGLKNQKAARMDPASSKSRSPITHLQIAIV